MIKLYNIIIEKATLNFFQKNLLIREPFLISCVYNYVTLQKYGKMGLLNIQEGEWFGA
jgi:hypothetical protein